MSRKKFFKFLYFSNNINDNIIEIKLLESITYKDYFCLTKLIHSAFINYQFGINNFIKTNYCSIFLSLSNPLIYSQFIYRMDDITFLQIKKCLSSLKKYAIHSFKIVKDYKEAINNELILNFIEDLANDDIRYKNSSIRQIKSHYIRQCNLHRNNYMKLISEEIFIDSTSLIITYYNKIKQLCHQSTPCLNTFQNTEEKMQQQILPEIQDTEISTLTDFELFSITMTPEINLQTTLGQMSPNL
jgi:hypothetical protein